MDIPCFCICTVCIIAVDLCYDTQFTDVSVNEILNANIH